MPPWFAEVMKSCEALSLDNERDRMILWERISEAWPRKEIGAIVYDNLPINDSDMERDTERIVAAVIAALEEA